jgi:hypothetical protein
VAGSSEKRNSSISTKYQLNCFSPGCDVLSKIGKLGKSQNLIERYWNLVDHNFYKGVGPSTETVRSVHQGS